ncbi:MAG: hypothetical protein U1F43_12275 [Myxococcota bacterium]
MVLALGPAPGPAADRCDARFQRSRAIIGGAWDEVDPAWGGYVQPRVVLEARRGNDVRARVVLAERAQSRSALATAQAALAPGVALCLPASGLGAGPVVLKTFEERLFQVADTGKVTAEEGRSPCRLDLAAVYRVGR